MKSVFKKGFTLAELVVTVVIIGFISAILVPKFWENTETIKRKAVLSETYKAIERHFLEEYIQNEHVQSQAQRWANLKEDVNYTMACGFSEGNTLATCAGSSSWTDALNGGGFRLPTGAVVSSVLNNTSGTDTIHVDVNGGAPPNSNCTDRFSFVLDNSTGEMTYSGCTATFLDG